MSYDDSWNATNATKLSIQTKLKPKIKLKDGNSYKTMIEMLDIIVNNNPNKIGNGCTK